MHNNHSEGYMKPAFILICILSASVFSQTKHLKTDELSTIKEPFKAFAIAEHRQVSKDDPVLQTTFFEELNKSLTKITGDSTIQIVTIATADLTKIVAKKLSIRDELRFYSPEKKLCFEEDYCPDVILFLKQLIFNEQEKERMESGPSMFNGNKTVTTGRIVTKDYLRPTSYYVYWDNKNQRVLCYGKVYGSTVPREVFNRPNMKGIENAIKEVVAEIAENAPVPGKK